MANSNRIILAPRDHALLRLLGRTTVTKRLVLKASRSFPEPFLDDRRVRERLQTLAKSGLVRAFTATAVGGLLSYYKLTAEGFRLEHGDYAEIPPRSFFSEIAPSRFVHTLTVAEIIVHTLVAAHEHRVEVSRFHRENELVLGVGEQTQMPDCHFELLSGGKFFHVLFEIDNSTESIDSFSHQSIKNKLLGYDAYQDSVLRGWAKAGRIGPKPVFRIAFLTKSLDRAYHILSLANAVTRNRDRRLFYAATQDAYLAEADAVRKPLFVDHAGEWQALVNLHPTASFLLSPVRLKEAVAVRDFVC